MDGTPNGSASDPVEVDAPTPTASFEVEKITPEGFSFEPAPVAGDAVLSVTFNNEVDDTTVVLGTNLTLTNETTSTAVTISLGTAPNARTLVIEPASALTSGHTYKISVAAGTGAIEDTAGQPVSTAASSYFKVASPTPDDFEQTLYLDTLALTKWEFFPLTAPTASGRQGMAVVIPTTGKLLLTETDVSTPGRGLSVDVTRTYRNNELAASGIFGNNWHCSYDRHFEVIADIGTDTYAELQFRSGDGRLFTYESQSSSTPSDFVSPPGFFDSLDTEDVGGTPTYLVQRMRDGTKFYYEFHKTGDTTIENPNNLPVGAKGYLVKIRDRNANEVVISRHAANHATRPNTISSIVDDLDRTTTFTYSTTSGQEHLVEKIEQFSGAATRSWIYTYDGNDSLVKVETPSTTWQDETGSPTTSRKSREYTYAASGSTYNLTGVEDGRDNVSLRVFYDAEDLVMQVDYGSGAAAGTAVYSFWLDSFTNQATQVDRNGNVLVLSHDKPHGAWQLGRANLTTKGVHPYLSGGQPSQYETALTCNADGQLTQLVSPDGRVKRILYCDCGCGCPCQVIHKYALIDALVLDPEAGMDQDLVWILVFEHVFSRLIRVIPPRGNDHTLVGSNPTLSIVDEPETVNPETGASTERTFDASNVDEAKRNAYATFIYYDHENVGDRLTADSAWIGDTVTLTNDLPQSFGRTGGAPYQDPPGGVLINNDRGGNPVAIRGAIPLAIESCAQGETPQAIEKAFSYNQYGQRILEVEPDGDRNRFQWYVGSFNLSTNPNRGYLEKVVVATEYTDADLDVSTGVPSGLPSGSGLELVTSYEYDLFGNTTSVTNPRGFETTNEVNHLNLVTKTTSPAPFEYERSFLHDGNNNLVKVSIKNQRADDSDDDGIEESGEQLVDGTHPDFVHEYSYTTANMLQREDLDAYGSLPATVSTRYEYDAKQLLVAVRRPEGNVDVMRYDERDLVYERVRGWSDSTVASRTLYDYDGDANLVQVIDDDGNLNPDQVITYDSFSRPTKWEDEIGNTVEVTYQGENLVVQRTVKGQARGPSDPVTSYLSNEMTEYDALGRPFQVARELFGANETLASLGLTRLTPAVDVSGKRVASGELVHTLMGYDADSNLVEVCDDNHHMTTYAYDAADRQTLVTDHLGSTVGYTYDAASNVIRITETEEADDASSTETYYTEQYFDELDRLIATVSHLGNTRRFLYDSRGNVIQVSDAMGSTSGGLTLSSLPHAGEHGTFPQATASTPASTTSINGRGNTVRVTYDGLSRRLDVIRDLRSGGTGAGAVTGSITTTEDWDGNSRIRARVDPNGNTTAYAYDHQDRLIRELFADGTDRRLRWNKTSTLALEVDPRGVVSEYGYDVLERRTSRVVSNYRPGVGQTTFAAWQYDGLSRVTKAEDDDSICEYFYDSLSREVEDEQQIGTGAPRTSSYRSPAGYPSHSSATSPSPSAPAAPSRHRARAVRTAPRRPART